MKGFLTGIGTMALTIVVLLFTGRAVFDLFYGLFENTDIGTIVGLIAVLFYGVFVAQIGLLLAVVFGATVNVLFDDKERKFNG